MEDRGQGSVVDRESALVLAERCGVGNFRGLSISNRKPGRNFRARSAGLERHLAAKLKHPFAYSANSHARALRLDFDKFFRRYAAAFILNAQ